MWLHILFSIILSQSKLNLRLLITNIYSFIFLNILTGLAYGSVADDYTVVEVSFYPQYKKIKQNQKIAKSKNQKKFFDFTKSKFIYRLQIVNVCTFQMIQFGHSHQVVMHFQTELKKNAPKWDFHWSF